MGDKDIKSYDFKASVDEQKPALKQNAAKPTTKASGMEKRSSTNTRGVKSNVRAEKQQKEVSRSGAGPVEKPRLQKNPKAGVLMPKLGGTLLIRTQVLFQYTYLTKRICSIGVRIVIIGPVLV
ncbi:unnamed protein product [Brassica rapa subsp. trilocularis]|uniref:(rape) hypothetical protein n=1 Tax=Brassica napus TaxID=3708 RepID=A0A816YL83_BRANA|nr:unnamed protein product [Brassica napus]